MQGGSRKPRPECQGSIATKPLGQDCWDGGQPVRTDPSGCPNQTSGPIACWEITGTVIYPRWTAHARRVSCLKTHILFPWRQSSPSQVQRADGGRCWKGKCLLHGGSRSSPVSVPSCPLHSLQRKDENLVSKFSFIGAGHILEYPPLT